MKRYFALLLAFALLIPVLAFPALAAETDDPFASGPLVLDDMTGYEHYIPFVLPEERYYLEVYDMDYLIWSGSFTLDFESYGGYPEYFEFDFPAKHPVSGDPGIVRIVLFTFVEQTILRVLYSEDMSLFDSYKLDSATFKLKPIRSVSDTVTNDVLATVLDAVVDVLPILLVVVIGFVGLRKGIAYVRRFLGNA